MSDKIDEQQREMRNRIEEAKKSEQYYEKAGLAPQQLIRPRRKEVEQISSTEKIIPKQSHEFDSTNNKSGNTTAEVIKPRKKSQQNIQLMNVDKEELAKTVTDIRNEYREIDKFTRKEEKRLEKERNLFEKKVEKLQHKVDKLVERDEFTEELTHTMEIQDNYMAAMKEINEHINKIKTDYDPEISLADRRRQIYENSKLASTERAQRLMYIRKLEAEGKSLSKGNAKPINKNSFYSMQLEQQQKLEFLKVKNPYQKRLQEVNERGGITMDETMAPQDRVAQQ